MPVISTILNTNTELYNYLNDVNYGMSKPQFNHLSSIVNGLINIKGNKTISTIAQGILTAKDRSCIYKFLSRSKWDDSLLNTNRINYINYYIKNNVPNNSVGFLVIDYTVNIKKTAKKMQGLSFNHSHAEGKRVWSHSVVTSNLVINDLSTPLQFQPYYSKDVCKDSNKPFKSKVDIAKDFISDFIAPDNCNSIYCLVDSWYTSTPLIESCLTKGFHLIGSVKSNRIVKPLGIRSKLSQLADSIDPSSLDIVTIKGKGHRVYRYEGPVGSFENAVVLICYEVHGEDIKPPMFILSTDISLANEKILEYYFIRWKIEINYKYLKTNLSFDKYRVRSFLSIERYFLLVFLAINFLEFIRFKTTNAAIKTIGDTINYIISLSAIDLVTFVYKSSKDNIPLQYVFEALRIAS